ncbi:MAG TPA: PadR family transcriptional regulator [Pyrinomonadaceae bacterium]|jgi:transcriptional regulator|nr:PadR family transcriptional regulator [Pyrinomonadaceae bacterium]
MEKIDLLQGTLHMLVLKTLSRGPMNGHALARFIKLTTEDALHLGEGTLYPALYRMERKGWITSKWGLSENNRKARYYRLTSAGRKQLAHESKAWANISDAIAKVMQTA